MAETANSREFIAARDLKIYQLRATGMSHADIAKALNISPKAVSAAISRQARRLNTQSSESFFEVLRLELDRLDKLQASVWPLAQHRQVTMADGSVVQMEPDLKAVETLLKISQDRRKLLGLDAAQKVTVDVAGEIKHNLHGAASTEAAIDYRSETQHMIQLMVESRIINASVGEEMLKKLESGEEAIMDAEVIEAEEPLAIED